MSNFARSTADLRLFRRIYLWDKDANLNLRTAISHFGDLRWGMPPYHVQLNMRMDGSLSPTPPWVAHYGSFFFGDFLPPGDRHNAPLKYWDTIEALSSVTLARDKALLLTAQHWPVYAGDNVLPDEYNAEDMRQRW